MLLLVIEMDESYHFQVHSLFPPVVAAAVVAAAAAKFGIQGTMASDPLTSSTPGCPSISSIHQSNLAPLLIGCH